VLGSFVSFSSLFLDLFGCVHLGMQKPGVTFKEVVLPRCDLLEFQ
jgi:hypothetical protein